MSTDGERVTERDAQTVLGRGPKILGVRTTTVLDKGYENGVLTERTFDHYAQDRQGNVWYMGEDTTSFEYDDDGNARSARAPRGHGAPAGTTRFPATRCRSI